MKENMFFKILCSLPVILLALYFMPFLGICLILFRYYVYRNSKYYKLPSLLLIIGFLLLIPKIINFIMQTFKLNIVIPYLNDIITSNIYIKLLNYSKLLIIVGVIFLIISFIFKNIVNKLTSKIKTGMQNYMEQDLKKDYEIRKENDLKMQEKREKAKNTHVVHCPYCGSTNMLTEKTGTCQYCRRNIE